MPVFSMYQPHIAQDSQSKLLHTSSAYKQFPRAEDELRSTRCRQSQQSDVLRAPTKDFKASVQITLTPHPPPPTPLPSMFANKSQLWKQKVLTNTA